MKKHLSFINQIILSIMAFLGFSCDPDDIGVEYGAPCADFKVTGTVVDELTQDNLNNIQVILSDALSSSYNFDTTYCDENGNYEAEIRSWPTSTAFMVQFKDPDGAHNGAYLPLDTIVDFTDEVFVNGDGSWYSGKKTKELNVKLSPDQTI